MYILKKRQMHRTGHNSMNTNFNRSHVSEKYFGKEDPVFFPAVMIWVRICHPLPMARPHLLGETVTGG